MLYSSISEAKTTGFSKGLDFSYKKAEILRLESINLRNVVNCMKFTSLIMSLLNQQIIWPSSRTQNLL